VDRSEDQALKKKKKHKNNKSKKNKIEECEHDSPEAITLQHFISKEDWEKLTLSQKKADTDEGTNKEENEDLREVLIQALQNPERYTSYFIEKNIQEALFTTKRATYIKFTDDDLLIGISDHNRPLYITGNYGGQKIGRILVDAGSSINIMPLKTLKTITLDVRNMSDEKVIIHGFNQNSQKALGAITLNLQYGSLKAPTKFYVIDAETYYRALLDR
jgi:hypothetical protein